MPEKADITGMRQLGQITTLRSSSNLKLISIDAAPAIRFERIKNTGKLGEASTLEEFIAREQAENNAPNAQRLFECMKLVDYHITNEASLEDLYAQLDEIITDK
jgi:dephospho-CoA kinase